jgi:hypothetical protein
MAPYVQSLASTILGAANLRTKTTLSSDFAAMDERMIAGEDSDSGPPTCHRL